MRLMMRLNEKKKIELSTNLPLYLLKTVDEAAQPRFPNYIALSIRLETKPTVKKKKKLHHPRPNLILRDRRKLASCHPRQADISEGRSEKTNLKQQMAASGFFMSHSSAGPYEFCHFSRRCRIGKVKDGANYVDRRGGNAHHIPSK